MQKKKALKRSHVNSQDEESEVITVNRECDLNVSGSSGKGKQVASDSENGSKHKHRRLSGSDTEDSNSNDSLDIALGNFNPGDDSDL